MGFFNLNLFMAVLLHKPEQTLAYIRSSQPKAGKFNFHPGVCGKPQPKVINRPDTIAQRNPCSNIAIWLFDIQLQSSAAGQVGAIPLRKLWKRKCGPFTEHVEHDERHDSEAADARPDEVTSTRTSKCESRGAAELSKRTGIKKCKS